MTMEKIKEAEVLQETYQTPSSEYDRKFSKTSQFMVPAIGINITNKAVFKYFSNAYLTDMQHKHDYVRPIFILFSVDDFEEKDWKNVYTTLTKLPNFITEYDVGVQDGAYLVMMVFQVPEKFENDYVNFKLGRYSQFSEEYKKKFPEFLDKEKKKKNIHWQIIHKDEDLKRIVEEEFNMEYGELDRPTMWRGNLYPAAVEIWDKPNKRECYRYVKVENEVQQDAAD